MLLAAFGVTVWDAYRESSEFHRAAQIVGWLAGATLAMGAILAWRSGVTFAAPVLRLLLMAAVASPQVAPRRHASAWHGVARLLPALLLAIAGLSLNFRPAGREAGGDSLTTSGLAALAAIACGGMGARALGAALGRIISASPSAEGWTVRAAYAMLTLLVSALGLAYLWRRGTLWGETTAVAVLAGAWLAWSAAILGRRLPSGPRNGVIVAAALLLVCAVAGDPTAMDRWVGADL
jgi:hypothetical protein